MHKYYKIIMVPIIITFAAVMCSGMISFGEQSQKTVVKNMLRERTEILQNFYYGKLDKEDAQKKLSEIETYPQLTKDIEALNVDDGCRFDEVKGMDFKQIVESTKMYHYATYEVAIDWSMSGLYGDYVTDGTYFVVIKSDGEEYKLSEFNLK